MRVVGVKRYSQFSGVALDGGTNVIGIINDIIGKFQFLPWFASKVFGKFFFVAKLHCSAYHF